MLNASQIAANDFDAKHCSKTNTHSAHEYTTFASAQLWRSRCEQRPSNYGDFDQNITGKVESITARGGHDSVPFYMTRFGLHFKWYKAIRRNWKLMLIFAWMKRVIKKNKAN